MPVANALNCFSVTDIPKPFSNPALNLVTILESDFQIDADIDDREAASSLHRKELSKMPPLNRLSDIKTEPEAGIIPAVPKY